MGCDDAQARCLVPVTANAIRLGVEEPDAAMSGGFSPSIRLPMVDRLCFATLPPRFADGLARIG